MIQWIRRKIQHWRIRSVLNEPLLGNRSKAILLFNLIKGDELKAINNRSCQVVKFPAPCQVEELTEALIRARLLVEKEMTMDAYILGLDNQEISIDTFFTSVDGYYVRKSVAYNRLKNEALWLLEHLRYADKTLVGMDEYYNRVLYKLLISIETLILVLAELIITGP